MERSEKKVSMPNYSRAGYSARHEMHKKPDGNNQIRGIEGKVERYLSPGAGYRAESVEGNKKCPMDNKIRGLEKAYHVTGGCPEKLPKGKMRNESDSGLR